MKKISVKSTFAFLLFYILSLNTFLYSKEIIVSKNSSIQSIKVAIELSTENDTILILKGIYSEGNIAVNKSVTILGQDDPVIDGNEKGEVFTITKKNVKISGLVIKNSGISYLEENAGIRLKEVSGCIISNNKFLNNFFAIYIAKSFDCIIENNFIKGEKKEKQIQVTEFIFGTAKISQ